VFLAPGGELVAQPQPAFAENSTAQIHAAARVVQQAAQAPTPVDLTCIVEVASLWADELIRQALMISFG